MPFLKNTTKTAYDENLSSENVDQVNDLDKSDQPNRDDEIS